MTFAMRNYLPLPLLLVVLFSSSSSLAVAQTREALFGGKASIVVPKGAQLLKGQHSPGTPEQYFVSFDSMGLKAATVLVYSLPKNQHGWSNAKWRQKERGYYTDPKNKRKYRFKNFKFQGKGNTMVTEVQSTFEDRGSKRTTRGITKEIRSGRAQVYAALYWTNPGSWNNKQSKALRSAVASFRLK